MTESSNSKPVYDLEERKHQPKGENHKRQKTNLKEISMIEKPNTKPIYDLEERTFQFAKTVRLFVKALPKTLANIEDVF